MYSSVHILSPHSDLLLYPSMTNRGVDEGDLNEKELYVCLRVTCVNSKRFIESKIFCAFIVLKFLSPQIGFYIQV
jgi:hypothetical protein